MQKTAFLYKNVIIPPHPSESWVLSTNVSFDAGLGYTALGKYKNALGLDKTHNPLRWGGIISHYPCHSSQSNSLIAFCSSGLLASSSPSPASSFFLDFLVFWTLSNWAKKGLDASHRCLKTSSRCKTRELVLALPALSLRRHFVQACTKIQFNSLVNS